MSLFVARTVTATLPATHRSSLVALTARGSGSSMFDAGVAQGVDVFVTSDVKHHPASELREAAEHRAAAGAPARPAVIDTAHFASEWPWLPVAARTLADDATARQETLETFVSHLSTDPWTARFDPRT